MNIIKFLLSRLKPGEEIRYSKKNPTNMASIFKGRGHLRGVGYTRKSHEESKKRRKMAKTSRRINRGKK